MVFKKIDFNVVKREYLVNYDRVHYDFRSLQDRSQGSKDIFHYSHSIHSDLYTTGEFAYVLNEKKKARELFTNAGHFFYEYNIHDPWGVKTAGGPFVGSTWLECAILSQNKNCTKKACSELLKTAVWEKIEGEIEPFFYETIILCHYLTGDMKNVKKYLPKLKKQEDKYMTSRHWAGPKWKGVYTILTGIFNEDKKPIIEGCIEALKKFSRDLTEYSPPLCSEVIKYLTLAEEKGLDFKIEDFPDKSSQYIKSFFEKDNISTEINQNIPSINIEDSLKYQRWFDFTLQMKDYNQKLHDRSLSYFKENWKNPSEYPNGYFGQLIKIGIYTYYAGEYALFLKRTDARKYFTMTCDLFYECRNFSDKRIKEVFTEVSAFSRFWINAALFTRDKKEIQRCASNLLQREYSNENKLELLVLEALTIIKVINEDLTGIDEILNRINNKEKEIINSQYWKGILKYSGRAKMLNGIITRDRNKFQDGLISSLKGFQEIYNEFYLPFSSEALKYIRIAEEVGFNINYKKVPEDYYKLIECELFNEKKIKESSRPDP